MTGIHWTENEKEILISLYENASKVDIQSKLPNRSWAGIEGAAKKLNLHRFWRRNRSRFCRVCGIELNEKNQFPYDRGIYYHICKKCRRERGRKYDRERYYRRSSDYWATHRLSTTLNGKTVYMNNVVKRTRPKCCELCGIKKRLSYHHWDIKGKIIFGVWICSFCHKFIERYETGFLDKYLKIKEQVNIELEEVKLNVS